MRRRDDDPPSSAFDHHFDDACEYDDDRVDIDAEGHALVLGPIIPSDVSGVPTSTTTLTVDRRADVDVDPGRRNANGKMYSNFVGVSYSRNRLREAALYHNRKRHYLGRFPHRDDSPSRDEKTRDERDDVDGGTNGRIKCRSGRTARITAKITGQDRGILLDDDSEREFLADSTMTTIDGRYVSASASDKKGGRCSKNLRRTEKMLEVDHGRCFLISPFRNDDLTSMHWRYRSCLDTIFSRRFFSSLAPSIPSCHPY
jgi:hypothetical protein